MIIKYDVKHVSAEMVEECMRAIMRENGRIFYLANHAKKGRTKTKNRRRLADMTVERILGISEPTEEVRKI